MNFVACPKQPSIIPSIILAFLAHHSGQKKNKAMEKKLMGRVLPSALDRPIETPAGVAVYCILNQGGN